MHATATRFTHSDLRLSAASACALAELLQVLSCGEESAAVAFDRLGKSCEERTLSAALAAIAADERNHQRLLADLSVTLPRLDKDPSLEARTRWFFMRLADRDIHIHCARIVAIDSAVCQILGALRRPGTPVHSDLRVRSILERIHRDEARHVAIASRCARSLLESTHGRDIVVDARERLTKLLGLRASSLDSLSVDPDQLFARLRALPRLARPAGAT